MYWVMLDSMGMPVISTEQVEYAWGPFRHLWEAVEMQNSVRAARRLILASDMEMNGCMPNYSEVHWPSFLDEWPSCASWASEWSEYDREFLRSCNISEH